MDQSKTSQTNWRDVARFDAELKARPGKTFLQTMRDAYGDDFPEEVEPHSFSTKTDLARILRTLAVGAGEVIVDLGCGRGGPGLWLARQTGADLIGINLSPNAIEQANQRIAEFGLGGRARFLGGDLCATSLPDQCCDAAISLDVIMFIPDQSIVMREVARILRPGAPFVFTAFEPRTAERYRAPLQENGFNIEVYEEKPDWRRRLLILYERTVAEQDALIAEMGEGIRTLIQEAEFLLADGLENVRHILVVARRR